MTRNVAGARSWPTGSGWRSPDIGNRLMMVSAWAPRVLSILRIMAGLLLLQHGLSKFFGFPMVQSPPAMSPSWFAGIFELVGGVLIALGLFTRPAAFLVSGMTAVAYFLVHAPKSFYPIVNGGELAVLYCFVFFYFTFAGPGPWSVDAKLKQDGVLPAWV
jgi:putative oxidoreductase